MSVWKVPAAWLIVVFLFTACKKNDKSSSTNLPPASFEISVTDLKPGSATLGWTEATDPEGKTVSYSVVIGADTINRQSERTIELNNLEENKKYDVTVIASDPQQATTKKTISFTTTAYNLPSPFEISLVKVGGSVVAISWTSSHLPDNSPVQYDVYLNDQLQQANLGNTTLGFEFRKLKELTLYNVKVVAKSAFNKTQQSSISFTTVQDPAPTGLSLQVKLVSYSLVKFSIGQATDAEGQSIRYSVFLDNSNVSSQLDTAIAPGKEYVLHSLSPERSYKLMIKATDEGEKTITTESTVATLKKPLTVIEKRSITKTDDGFIYNLETGVDYKPSKIILNTVAGDITTQPPASSIVNGNTISYTYPDSYLPGEGYLTLQATLFWGDETERSQTASFDAYYYNFKPTSVVIQKAQISRYQSTNEYFIYFKDGIISPDPNYFIAEVVFGTQPVAVSVVRSGGTTGYLRNFVSLTQLSGIDDGPRTGYVIMHDNTGYHKLEFTFSYF